MYPFRQTSHSTTCSGSVYVVASFCEKSSLRLVLLEIGFSCSTSNNISISICVGDDGNDSDDDSALVSQAQHYVLEQFTSSRAVVGRICKHEFIG